MNWGIRITVLYLSFAIMIVSLVSLTMKERVDLVSSDYYERELKYQEKIDRINVTNQLKEKPTWIIHNNYLKIDFHQHVAKNDIEGSILFFRPSDPTLDKEFNIKADTNAMQEISLQPFKRGIYKIEINWSIKDANYYSEGIIQIN